MSNALVEPADRERIVAPTDSVLVGLKRFVTREPAGALAAAIFVLIFALVILGPSLVAYDPVKIDLVSKFIPPGGGDHLFGTDQLGRDLLSRVLVGGRISLGVSLAALVIGVGIGSSLGIVAGFLQHWSMQLLQRLMDGLMSLPALVLALSIATALGNSATNVLIAICIVMLPSIFRVIRSATIAVRYQDYVTAAHALGASDMRIMARHIVPNVVGTIVTVASIWIGNVIIIEASLGFLGLGAQPPQPSWGNMLSGEGRSYMVRAPWMAIVPGVAISLTVLASNMLGDSLRTFFDPKSRRVR